MYRAYVSKIVVFDSASRLGTSIEIEQAHAFDGIRGFGTAGGVPLRNVETDILKGFFTKLKKAFLRLAASVTPLSRRGFASFVERLCNRRNKSRKESLSASQSEFPPRTQGRSRIGRRPISPGRY
jgi:hypothetical protein